MANGNFAPKRVIEGQATKISRTIHVMDYDPVHDEIIASNPQAGAVLVFRGGANGNEPPIRVIQGPKTGLVAPHGVAADTKNGEILVMDPGSQSVMAFPWNANGDVAPTRMIRGPKSLLMRPMGAAVDPERDLLIVANTSSALNQPGIFVFNRTDNGDVAPRAIISGPKTGIDRPWQVQVHQGKIYAAIAHILYVPLYADVKPRVTRDTEIRSPWRSDRVGFIGVWKTTDNGDVPPLAVIKGPISGLVHPGGLAINVKDREIYVADSVRNGLFTFLVPQFFKQSE
jgi:DNA-binding beta-propeller fold protein YncE